MKPDIVYNSRNESRRGVKIVEVEARSSWKVYRDTGMLRIMGHQVTQNALEAHRFYSEASLLGCTINFRFA